jgi:tetratricopeptide (TPR) repeat protein
MTDGMPMRSDAHLEKVLAEFNDKVSLLEGSDEPELLLEAYVNRGRVLSMMESWVSAVSDFDSAVDLMEEMESRGMRVDAGTHVRAFTGRGEILGGADMVSDYAAASRRLGELDGDSRHYSRKSIVGMCSDCAEDLLDEGRPEDAAVFAEKALSLASGGTDRWSRNREAESLGLLAQSLRDRGEEDAAAERLSELIDLGTELASEEELDDPMVLVYALIARGDLELERGLTDMHLADHGAAVSLLDDMHRVRRLDDPELLVGLHQDLAKTYFSLRRVEDAERHLLRVMELGVGGARDYLDAHAGRKG